MTSLAFILGCVPMAIAKGAGANSLRAIGTGVIGGMLASTLVATFFVPVFYVILDEGAGLFGRKKKAPGDGGDDGGHGGEAVHADPVAEGGSTHA
jgi:multidrug efflux pump